MTSVTYRGCRRGYRGGRRPCRGDQTFGEGDHARRGDGRPGRLRRAVRSQGGRLHGPDPGLHHRRRRHQAENRHRDRAFTTRSASTWWRCASTISWCRARRRLFFLDYFATGTLDVARGAARDRRHRRGLPHRRLRPGRRRDGGNAGHVRRGDYDLAGFAVGAAERGELLPRERRRRAMRFWGWPPRACIPTGFRWCARSSRPGGARLARRRTVRTRRAPLAEVADGADADLRAPMLALHRAGLAERWRRTSPAAACPAICPACCPTARRRCWTRRWAMPAIFPLAGAHGRGRGRKRCCACSTAASA